MSDTTPTDLTPGEISEVQNDNQVVPMVLISLEQRNALIEFLAKLPYQDVASGINFLREAPVVNVNVTTRKEESESAA